MENNNFWNDDTVIDFLNWYVDVCGLSERYKLENETILESFKNGDKPNVWKQREY